MMCVCDGSFSEPVFSMGYGALCFGKSGNLTQGTQLYLVGF